MRKPSSTGPLNPLQSRAIKGSEKIGLSYDECKQMIQAAYNQAIQNSSIKSETIPSKMDEKSTSDLQHRSNYYENNNSTNIDTEYYIGPDGDVMNILHLSKGEAENSAAATDNEIQVHENLKDSRVNFFNLLIPVTTPPTSRRKIIPTL